MPEVDEPIEFSAYDPGWPAHAAAEEHRLAGHLPAGTKVEHIGSTSVHGIPGKPTLDLMVGLEAHHNREAVRSALVRAGYEDLGEAGVPGRIYLRRRDSASFNIALVERGGRLWLANLALRDFLRKHPHAALEYAATKRAAIEAGHLTLLAYSNYKSNLLTRLVAKAIEWSTSPRSG